MPGTKLHDDFKNEGRLDHFDWQYYDTRHVVFEPENMTREQLLDGYCYLFEEAYASERALDRLERFWRKYKKHKSGFIKNYFLKWKLRKYSGNVSEKFDFLLEEGWKRISTPGINSDIVQLLYYLDSAHFVEYLNRFKSPNFEQNVEIFIAESNKNIVSTELLKRQWEHKKNATV